MSSPGTPCAVGSADQDRPGDVRIYLSDCERLARPHGLAAAAGPARGARGHLHVGQRERARREVGARLGAHGGRPRHGLGRPDRLRVGGSLHPGGLRRDRARERHARPLLRPGRVHAPGDRAAPARVPRLPLARRGHPRHRGRGPDLRRARRGHRAGGAHRGAAVPRLGGLRPAHRLRRERQRHAQPAPVDARALPGRDLRLHLHEQGLRRHAEPAAARGARDAARAARRPPVLRRDRHDDDDRRLDALAVRRREGGRRPHGPGVRPLLRHARRSASAPAASPARTTPGRCCTASSPT